RFCRLTSTLKIGTARSDDHAELGEDHYTPWGVIHGGVYTSIVESAANIGASHAVADRGEFAVGVHNATDFLRPSTGARVDVEARPHYQDPAAVGGHHHRFRHRQPARPRSAAPAERAPAERLRLPDEPGRGYPGSSSRRAFLRIFPVEVVGRASTNSTALGALLEAMRVLT